MTTPDHLSHHGRCLCGAVVYEVIGPPVLLTICHCTFCQRATGSSFLVEPIWRDRDFKITSGNPKCYEVRSSGSGKQLTLRFCENCGTKVFQTMERFPGVVGVYGGTLDETAIVAEAQQTWRIFIDHAQKGTILPPGVDIWPQHRLGNDGSPAQSITYDKFHVI